MTESEHQEPWFSADRKLAAVQSSFDFLTLTSPADTDKAWEQFERSRFERAPDLPGPAIDLDLSQLRRDVESVNPQHVDDVDVQFILAGKQIELERKLQMLSVRGSVAFLSLGMLHYGAPDADLLKMAKSILRDLSPDEKPADTVDADQIRERAEAELRHYRSIDPRLESTVRQEEGQAAMQASHGDVLVPADMTVSRQRMEALMQHEVGVHVVTYHNGAMQPLQVLRNGLAEYDELQEGIGVLAEFFADGLTPTRMRTLAARVLAVDSLENRASFVETFRLLKDDYGLDAREAFEVAAPVHACGGFPRDQIYLRGLRWLLRYLAADCDLEPLFIGKLGRHTVPAVERLAKRGFLKPPVLRPRFLEGRAAERKLERLRAGMTPLDLVTPAA